MPPSLELRLRKRASDNGLVQFLALIALAVTLVVKLVWTVVRAPILGLGVLVLVCAGILYWLAGYPGLVAQGFACLLLLGAWFLHGPSAFRSWWRVRFRYLFRYWPRWNAAMRAAKLTSLDPLKPTEIPKVAGFTGNDYVDTLTAEMLPGQTTKFYVLKSEGIGQTLGASGCRAVENAKSVHLVDLWLWHDDPLKKLNPRPFPIPEPPADGDWYRWFQREMKYGIFEDGTRCGIDLTQRHWLIVGKSRSGKSSSRVWPVVRMSIPMVAAGRLRYGVCDFKEGMELRAGKPVFEQNGGWFAQTIPEAARLLRAEVDRMLKQAHEIGLAADTATSAAGISRKLDRLTKEQPWTVIVVDELKSVMNGLDYQEERRTIVNALLLIQQIGLACGYSEVAGTQQGHKDILGELREGYTAMDCLAVEYQSETWMLFEKEIADQYMIAPHRLHIPEPEDPDQSGDQAIGWQRNPSRNYPRVRGCEVTNEDIWDFRTLLPGAWDRSEPVPTEDPKPEVKPEPPRAEVLHIGRLRR